MKLLSRFICVLAFIGFSQVLSANVEPSVSIRSQKNQSFSLHLKNMNNETFQIQLIDLDGFVLLSEKVKNQEDYLKLYNLKNLPAGDYRLRIENDTKIVFQNLAVFNGQVTVDASSKEEIIKPTPKVGVTEVQNSQELSVNTKAIMNKINWIKKN